MIDCSFIQFWSENGVSDFQTLYIIICIQIADPDPNLCMLVSHDVYFIYSFPFKS